MKSILMVILSFISEVTIMAISIPVNLEKGYLVEGDKVYYDSTMKHPPMGKIPDKKIMKMKNRLETRDFSKLLLVSLADAEAFSDLGRGYGLDHKNVFYRGVVINGADPATFQAVEKPEGYMQAFYFKDKKNVYYKGQILKGADPGTFRYYTTEYAVDKNNVYGWGEALDINPYFFITLKDAHGGVYIVGSGKVHYGGRYFVDVNPESFRLLGDAYATDGQVVVYGGKTIEADAKTFRKLFSPEGMEYAPYNEAFYIDKDRVYNRGRPVEGTNGDARVLGKMHLISNKTVFYGTDVISGADPDSFISLSDNWGKDNQTVFYEDMPVKEADPATFRTAESYWQGFDKNNFFERTRKRLSVDGESFRHCYNYLYVDDKYAYIISRESVRKVPVDGKSFEEVGYRNGKIYYKDKNNFYEYSDETKFRKTKPVDLDSLDGKTLHISTKLL